jgi:hypothetical protein
MISPTTPRTSSRQKAQAGQDGLSPATATRPWPAHHGCPVTATTAPAGPRLACHSQHWPLRLCISKLLNRRMPHAPCLARSPRHMPCRAPHAARAVRRACASSQMGWPGSSLVVAGSLRRISASWSAGRGFLRAASSGTAAMTPMKTIAVTTIATPATTVSMLSPSTRRYGAVPLADPPTGPALRSARSAPPTPSGRMGGALRRCARATGPVSPAHEYRCRDRGFPRRRRPNPTGRLLGAGWKRWRAGAG